MVKINKISFISKYTLYLVPTPIGNLADITYRGLYILRNVDIIAAENIQHTDILLKKFDIKKNFFYHLMNIMKIKIQQFYCQT